MQVIIGSFEGGYESRISYALDTVLDEIVDGYNDEHGTDFSSDDFNFDINMKGYLLACAENFVGEITADSNINPKNIKVHSPRQYNFETDTIEFSLTERECNFMRVQVLRKSKYIAEWKRICDNRFKKHSGYVPFYSAPDLDTDCKYWNEHQLGALFDCYFFEEIDNNDDSDDYWSAIVEDAFNFIEYEEPIAESRSRKHLRRLSLTESKYTVQPKTKDELAQIIKDHCEENGWNSDLNFIDTSLITDMSYLFSGSRFGYGLEKFNGDISKWDVSNVKDMSCMFRSAESFNQPLDNWNVSNVKDMNSMFCYAKSFNQPLNNWNVSNVKDMGCMFARAKSFNQPLDNWNVSNVKDMCYIFGGSKLEKMKNFPDWY